MSAAEDTQAPVDPPRIIAAIDRINRAVGIVAAWAMLPVVLICFAVVVLRYAFGIGYIWLQELFIWIHGAAFMAAVGYAFAEGAHVRVDMIYRGARARTRAWLDIIGVVAFLFVMCGVLFYVSIPQVALSWRLAEGSSSLSGLPYVYVIKTFIPVFCVLAILHGISLLWRCGAVLRAGRSLRPGGDPQ